jgi:YD repeat-containing protein
VTTLGLQPVSAVAAPTPSNPITYVYDEIGRLEAVVDPTAATNGVARYAYDDVGNLTSITRSAVTSIGIIDFHGARGPVGTPVTIYGTSFNATPSQNQVKFGGSNGTAATVTAATSTTLRVTVPSGAASGTIYVKNIGTNKSVTSTKTYTVVGSLTPTITGISPAVAAPGSTVTLTGTNFDTTGAAWNSVYFGNVRAQVTGVASATSLTAKVPPFVGGGKVSVQTVEGQGTSNADFTGPPAGFAASDIASTSRITIGQASTLQVTTANKVAIGLFDATKGQAIFVNIPSSSGPNYSHVGIYDGFGRQVIDSAIAPSGGYIDHTTLPDDGTYELVFDPGGSDTGTLSFTMTDAGDVSSPVQPGTPATLSTTRPGQRLRFTFSAAVGERFSAEVTGSTYPCCPYVSMVEPTQRVLNTFNWFGSSTFLDTQTITWSGSHSVYITPGVPTGQATLTLYQVPPDPNFNAVIGGPAVTASTSVPGQNYTVSFSGSANQRVSILEDNSTFACCPDWQLVAPDNSVLASGNYFGTLGESFTDPVTLPQNGTYTIKVDPRGNAVGSDRFRLYDVPPDPNFPITINGPSVVGSNTAPGQNFTLTFTGSAGQVVTLTLTTCTYPGGSSTVSRSFARTAPNCCRVQTSPAAPARSATSRSIRTGSTP